MEGEFFVRSAKQLGVKAIYPETVYKGIVRKRTVKNALG